MPSFRAVRPAGAARSTPRPSICDTPLAQALPEPLANEGLDRRSRNQERASDQALIGRLLRGCLDRGIEPRTRYRAVDLIPRKRRVRRVVVETPDGTRAFDCDAVILGTGGFAWNDALKHAFLRVPMTHSVAIETNTGDGLTSSATITELAQQLGIPASALDATVARRILPRRNSPIRQSPVSPSLQSVMNRRIEQSIRFRLNPKPDCAMVTGKNKNEI